MMYVSYAFCALISILMFVFTYITCPIWGLLAAILKRDALPYPLSLLHTHDDNVFGAKMRRSTYGETDAIPTTFTKRFTTACWWIWRNPNYGFNANVLGLPIEGTTITLDEQTFHGTDYTRWTLFDCEGTKYFGYAIQKSYTKTKYFKLWIGWQWHPLDNSDRYMLKCSFNPFRTIGG